MLDANAPAPPPYPPPVADWMFNQTPKPKPCSCEQLRRELLELRGRYDVLEARLYRVERGGAA